MPMHYPPLSDGTYRYGDPPRPLPSPVPGPDPAEQAPHHHAGHGNPGNEERGYEDPGPGPHGPPGQHPPHGPGDGPDGDRTSGRTAAAVIIGVAALVVVVILGLALTGPGSGSRSGPTGMPRGPLPPQAWQAPERAPGELFDVEGSFTVMSSPGEPVSGDGSGCDLPLTLSDIGEGTRITLSQGVSTLLGSTMLAYEGGDLSSCTFTFDFGEVPSGAPFYLIEIPGRGQLTYTEDELRAGVDITLGR
ncbi:hypothetical protein H483_0117115 [Dietzia sp. UCD-THP]|uniref:Uncharacterized protein n=1 Tax=Dietzia natronolimnaea TaxID=161920 RepID=A0A2A2WQ43_9ACTN|nr:MULTISPECIES: hypothetical protein [Dietzia]EYT56429.1 hypothetical protein H483_0117115 [Dietzia sp. UCD-THP]PAY23349.1 hypothetical protein CEY15_08510 [Dietzia natronolimnaea]